MESVSAKIGIVFPYVEIIPSALMLDVLPRGHGDHSAVAYPTAECVCVRPQNFEELCFWTLSIVWCLKNKQN
jgi:hypothetical protein